MLNSSNVKQPLKSVIQALAVIMVFILAMMVTSLFAIGVAILMPI